MLSSGAASAADYALRLEAFPPVSATAYSSCLRLAVLARTSFPAVPAVAWK